MAVITTPVASDLVMVMDNGTGASGQALSKSHIYKDIKSAADNADIYDVAATITGLQDKTVLSIQRRNIVELENEE